MSARSISNLLAVPTLTLVTMLSGCVHGCQDGGGQDVSQRTPETLPLLDLSSGLTEASLRPYIGRQVKVIGSWDSRGKISGYIYGGDKAGEELIYVKATNEQQGLLSQNQLESTFRDGTPVTGTGVLHWYEPGKLPESQPLNSDAPARAEMPGHFYFDVEQAIVEWRPTPEVVSEAELADLIRDAHGGDNDRRDVAISRLFRHLDRSMSRADVERWLGKPVEVSSFPGEVRSYYHSTIGSMTVEYERRDGKWMFARIGGPHSPF